MESSNGKLKRLTVFSFLRTNIDTQWILSPGFCPHCSSPFDIWCVHSPWHVLILFKSEWKPSIWAYSKPLRRHRRVRIVICLRYSPIYHTEPFFLTAYVALDNITTLFISPSSTSQSILTSSGSHFSSAKQAKQTLLLLLQKCVVNPIVISRYKLWWG